MGRVLDTPQESNSRQNKKIEKSPAVLRAPAIHACSRIALKENSCPKDPVTRAASGLRKIP
jgi:hypothetical protein